MSSESKKRPSTEDAINPAKQRLKKINAFFKRKEKDDIFLIQSVDYDSWTVPWDIYFTTKDIAKEFVDSLQKNAMRHEEYRIIRFRKINSMDNEFVKLWFEKSDETK